MIGKLCTVAILIYAIAFSFQAWELLTDPPGSDAYYGCTEDCLDSK